MVAHTHSSLSLGLLNEYKYYYENTKDDLIWCFSDPGWVKAIYSYFYTTWLGGSGVFVYEMPRFNPEVTLSVLRKYPITLCSAVATCYRMMLEHEKKDQLNLSPTLRACNTGGESIDHHVIDDWEARTGIRIRIAYGQTEMLPISSQRRSVPYKAGTLGRPGLGIDVVILDENLAEVSRKEEGQIAVKIRPYRPLSLFQEYLEDPVKTAEVFKGDYYLTGDRGYMDEDGYLWFVGRNDDVINSAGYRIGPAEVEEALNSHPAVAESAVVSSPDVERGVVVKAFVVVRDGIQSGPELVRSLQDHVKSITAPYKYPRKVEFVESLPKTVSGKLQRALLRQKEWSNQNKHG